MARRRVATDAERVLWSTAMRDVRPLKNRPVIAAPASASPPKIEPMPAAPVTPLAAKLPCVPGVVDRATVDRMRRGQVTVDARIDLHGMDQRTAFAALMGFVETSSRAGRRALLVITGKGSVGEGAGVLRRNAPAWLLASPQAGRILATEPAHPRHGGDGAFYVLLRRKR